MLGTRSWAGVVGFFGEEKGVLKGQVSPHASPRGTTFLFLRLPRPLLLPSQSFQKLPWSSCSTAQGWGSSRFRFSEPMLIHVGAL